MMKRRTIIAIIITAIIVFLTNKAWLKFSPMSVAFDILGKGICNIEVQLNKENNDKFKKIKSLEQQINLDTNTHTVFLIDRAKTPKKIRFVFNSFNTPVKIKNIALKGGKYKLEDLDRFTLSEGKLTIQNNTLLIPPPTQEKYNYLNV